MLVRIIAIVAAATAALGTSSCHACTDAGCANSTRIGIVGVARLGAGAHRVKACTGRTCAEWSFTTGRDWACDGEKQPPFSCSYYEDRDQLSLGLPLDAMVEQITVEIDRVDGGTSNWSGSQLVAADDSRPNGEECDPVCHNVVVWFRL